MNDFQLKLKTVIDEYVNFIYQITKDFPKEEIYGSTSQIKRSSLSIILNYIEGYARYKPLVRLNFLEIAYGSLMESDYLLDFSRKQMFITENNYNQCKKYTREIGAMLWTETSNLRNSLHTN
ncbi:MAG: hypothetical protein COU81_04000 [Candidatus Portnoybacteria bacterium CG10_big_fil_rev_8_21_14_0_10_36_7]|uniref:Four helix bundle protein n=1 Tax=Candidatus Portnoybacteria bacterium CG10_big_fil_rev_8_21_14_0_10_36_7 TaxID=1974812 RepID=A0A2M8KD35_9BACT|nr:MAG: hypothetical protein COU81_04000 [Candidatus Portnoybacteria bacterium CG10_big_fil_rev_8_21_14_0_10_36_7]